MFRLTRIFPFECCPGCPWQSTPWLHDICTAIFLFTRSGASGFFFFVRLAASFLTPAASSQTRPNLGGVKDLSVSRTEVITVVPASPAALLSFRSWRKSSRRVRGTAWQVDSTASSPGADIAGPGNWPHWLSNAPASKPNLLAVNKTAHRDEIKLGHGLELVPSEVI